MKGIVEEKKLGKTSEEIKLLFQIVPLKVLSPKRSPPSPFMFYDKLEGVGDLKKVVQQCEFATTIYKSSNVC
jgi:hypothetical protein